MNLFRKLKVRDDLDSLVINGRIILKRALKEIVYEDVDWFYLTQDVNDSAESLGFIGGWELLENLKEYQVRTQNFSLGERGELPLRPQIVYVWI